MSARWLAAVVFSVVAAQALLLLAWALARRWMQRNGNASGRGLAWQGLRRFRVARTYLEVPDGTIRSFHLVPVDARPLPPYLAGQYLTLRLADGAGDSPAAQPLVRCYSLSDAPSPDHYRISVKRIVASQARPAGAVSSHLHERIREGDEVQLRAPSGRFVLDPADPRAPVLVSAGIGITPIWAMLKVFLASNPGREVWFFHGARSSRDHPFRSELDELRAAHSGLHAHVSYSQPGPGDRLGVDFQAVGHVDIGLLERVLPEMNLPCYVCGPGAMMESLVPAMRNHGIPELLIHYEGFGPSSLDANTGTSDDAAVHLVTFSRSQRTVSWSAKDGSLLDLAERHGIDVASGCRAGNCGTCQTAVESGTVACGRPPEYDVQPGWCLLCVCRPTNDLVLGA